jgi:hypothetical protein
MTAFPAIVNRIPPGLLSLLGLKNTGRNPGQLSDVIGPSLEMLDWYLWSQAEAVASGAQTPSAGAQAAFQTFAPTLMVPQTEWWWVHWYSVQFNNSPTAAVTGTIVPYLIVLGTSMRSSPVNIGTGVNTITYAEGPKGFFCPPGSTFNLAILLNAGTTPANLSCSGIVHMTRLPI